MLRAEGKHIIKDDENEDFARQVEDLKRIETMINVAERRDPISWNVQVFRSIDSGGLAVYAVLLLCLFWFVYSTKLVCSVVQVSTLW
jgi:hypothetical protein